LSDPIESLTKYMESKSSISGKKLDVSRRIKKRLLLLGTKELDSQRKAKMSRKKMRKCLVQPL
jgi:hypothetical protein